VSLFEIIAFAMRVYKAALTPLKLMLKDNASERLVVKFFIHNT
jgi:hypothetical protein